MTRPVRIANVSGFYGDRLSAAAEMLAGPDPVDVLTGDYLAELTMLILWKARRKDPDAGFATTFLRQMQEVLGTCVERGVKVVANAGGLNPGGLAARLEALGTGARIAVVEGDDVLDRFAGDGAVTASAYLGGWGIAAGLAAGADVVVTGRVTDAALVSGTAAWWHGWALDDWDRLAGAVVAGHVIECGPQATGGNYALADELPDLRAPGFPIAEVAEDGSAIISKQPGTGGVVSTGTVTAQLLYEIGSPAYLNPDVTSRFDTIRLSQEGPDRVRVEGTRGLPPPPDLKVACNRVGGWRNSMTMVLPGLDPEAKAERATALLADVLGAAAEHDVRLTPAGDALAHLTVTVKDPDPEPVGRRFSNAVTELALASYAGFHTTTPPQPASEYGVYWPATIARTDVTHTVLLPSGVRLAVPDPPTGVVPGPPRCEDHASRPGPTRRVPLGTVCGARSGDKGGDANVGVWCWDDEAFGWLGWFLTADRVRELVPEAGEVVRYDLPNLRALNVVLVGLLGEGVASSTRPDPQAKGLGELLRSRLVDVPCAILDA